ncbi:hypothetical protein [Neisseria sp. Ec49-e6-T10]|uniref:hypothetical protein n=1 Tax=Neisseria sp. Ec49-e6-T10 TaxID=3140744 RepID=UPI003EBA8E15
MHRYFMITLLCSLFCLSCSLEASNKEGTVTVMKSLGVKQCEGGSVSAALIQLKNQLLKAQINVLDEKSSDDGMMHIMVCGANTGDIGVFTIPKKQEIKARRLGFELVND